MSKKTTVFISYAKEDEELAQRIYSDLKEAGVDPWFDKGKLQPGQRWEVEIPKAIWESSYFIPVFSSISVKKRGYVQKEFQLALDVLKQIPESQIYVIPVRLDDCEPPYEEFKKFQWVDLFPSRTQGMEKIIHVITGGRHTLRKKESLDSTANAQLDDLLIETLSGSINDIVHKRQESGHWRDVRCTTLALWALNDIVESLKPSSDILITLKQKQRNANKWLSKKATKEEPGIAWDSEAWDTSLAIIALTFDETYRKTIEQATQWLHDIRDITIIRGRKSGVWYDEVWETTLSTIALLRSEAIRRTPMQPLIWIEEVLSWLTAIPSKTSGEFVCPHYSGFLVWLLGEIQQSSEARPIRGSMVFEEFSSKVEAAYQWLLSIRDDESDDLWSLYTFSNSYIIMGLSSLKQPLPTSLTSRIIRWYYNKSRKSPGVFEDIEDTSLAILALSSLMEGLKINRTKLMSKIIWAERAKK